MDAIEHITPRLVLRPFDNMDAGWLHALDNDPEVMRHINGGIETPASFVETVSLPLFMTPDPHAPGLGYRKLLPLAGGDPLGWCCLRSGEAPGTASLGYRLRRDAWGRGYATEAAGALLDHGFRDLGLARVVAATYEHNTPSIRVLERLGFRLERRYREDLADQRTAYFEGTEAFPGLDLAWALAAEDWFRGADTTRRGVLARPPT
jgi:RimJ/RimL family protein N-acetyltransferase